MDPRLSRYLLQLRRHHPFLAAVALMARVEFSDDQPNVVADGRTARINPDYYDDLDDENEQFGLLLHLTLHNALLHAARRGLRDDYIWNVAADIVVNQIILDAGVFEPPAETALAPQYKDLSVEQVYDQLCRTDADDSNNNAAQSSDQGERSAGSGDNQSTSPNQAEPDAKSTGSSTSSQQNTKETSTQQSTSRSQPKSQPTQAGGASPRNTENPVSNRGNESMQSQAGSTNANQNQPESAPSRGNAKTASQRAAVQAKFSIQPDLPRAADSQNNPNAVRDDQSNRNYWKAAFQQAIAVQNMAGKGRGDTGLGLAREISAVLEPSLNWRTLLWRYVARTPCDFSGFDRRFIHAGLYLEQLQSESLKLWLAIDTSGSIDDEDLAQFLAELRSILSAYPNIESTLFYVDAEVNGPYPVDLDTPLPVARGGGGTDFDVFFRRVESYRDNNRGYADELCIYMTDGDGEFPPQAPDFPVLWVSTTATLSDKHFPFGDVVSIDRYS